MKIIALDFGLKKIGTAITDDSQRFVFTKETLANDTLFVSKLGHWIVAEKVGLVVIGKSPSPEIATASEKLAKKIETVCKLPVLFIDESYSTKEAQDIMWTLALKKKQRKNFDDDSAAAANILERYLQSRSL